MIFGRSIAPMMQLPTPWFQAASVRLETASPSSKPVQPFFIDFGYKGIAFFAAIYGSVCGWLYRLFRNRNSVGTCLYAYAVYVLVMQFYQENIFLSLVFILQFVFFVILFTQQKIKIST